jgi:tetratricopeptide (TPR) repeat protein
MLRLLTDAIGGRATVDHITDRVEDEERDSRREIASSGRAMELAPTWRSELAVSEAMAQHALALEQKADYAGALTELRIVRSRLESLAKRNPGNQVIARSLADKRSRTGSVLVAIGRPAEAATEVEAAMELLGPLVSADRGNAQYRGDLAYAWYRLAEALRAQGQLSRALDLHQKALVVRRERVARDPTFTFIRWDLCRSLNATGQLLLLMSPPDPGSATALFEEARELAETTLTTAPSFNELRKEIAKADEGLGHAAIVRAGRVDANARLLLERSLRGWQDVLARGPEDRREARAPLRVQTVLSAPESIHAR